MSVKKKRTALVLSGGGSRGAYEIGVWQALKEMNIKIDIVTGTSAGALNGAVIVQDLFEEACALWKSLETDKVFDFSDALRKGGASYTDFKETLDANLDEEAIRNAEMDFGFVTVEFPAMTPRYLWKEDVPQGQLIDYILASASCFPAVQSYEIGDSRFIDGGYSDNMPVGMALEKGATHVIAVDLASMGVVKKKELERLKNLIWIQSGWDLGNFLVFDTGNSKRIMRLGYLDAMKAYGAYEGRRYCFIKGHMDKRVLKGAEQAAAIFELDPGKIYSKEIFNETLKEALTAYERAEKKEIRRRKSEMGGEEKGSPESAPEKEGKPGTAKSASEKADKSGLAKKALNQFFANLARLPQPNSKTLLLLLANHMKETDVNRSLLFTRPVLSLLSKEIAAAHYLVRERLV